MHLHGEETICALSTPPGRGALNLIRVSGREALLVTRKICPFLPSSIESHRIYYGWMKGGVAQKKIDEVLVSYFEKGRSYTGEESLEISCHGSPQVSRSILKALIASGAKLAKRGEFTYRAFINGKIDLVQAENVLALIRSRSERAKKLALDQLEGNLSKCLREILNELLSVKAHIEAQIDFSEENLEVQRMSLLRKRVFSLLVELDKLSSTFEMGKYINDGISIVLMGPPNGGKSSLFNLLIGKDQAIVAHTPGTTRDLIESDFFIEDFEFCIKDTAGLRETHEKVEQIGIHKAKEAALRADVILYILDVSKEVSEKDLAPLLNASFELSASLASSASSAPLASSTSPVSLLDFNFSRTFFIGNKVDLDESFKNSDLFKEKVIKVFKNLLKGTKNSLKEDVLENLLSDERFLTLSAKKEFRIKELKDRIKKFSLKENRGETSVILTHVRHYELISRSQIHLKEVSRLMEEEASLDLIAFEVQEALLPLYEVLGEEWNEQVIDQIFKEFCLGK